MLVAIGLWGGAAVGAGTDRRRTRRAAGAQGCAVPADAARTRPISTPPSPMPTSRPSSATTRRRSRRSNACCCSTQTCRGCSSSSARCISAWARTSCRAPISNARSPPARRREVKSRIETYLAEIARLSAPRRLSGFFFFGAQYQSDANLAPGSPLVHSPVGDVLLNSQFVKKAGRQCLRHRGAPLQHRSRHPGPRHDRDRRHRLRQPLRQRHPARSRPRRGDGRPALQLHRSAAAGQRRFAEAIHDQPTTSASAATSISTRSASAARQPRWPGAMSGSDRCSSSATRTSTTRPTARCRAA